MVTCLNNDIDVSETADGYHVKADVPGFSKQEIDLQVRGNTLYIKGDHKEKETKGSESSALRMERRQMEHFERLIQLPDDVDPNKVKASLNHGILNVQMSKAEHAVKERTHIAIE